MVSLTPKRGLAKRDHVNGDAAEEVGDDLIDLGGSVGVAGENFFDTMANDGRAVANKVSRDRLGWDFHLQLPRQPGWQLRHTLDTRPAEPSCFVQVKSTTRRCRSWRMKLSNWERLAKERRPVFFVVFMYAPGELMWPVDAYVVHLGEELLGRVLRELRVFENEDAVELNHSYMSFTWSEADRLPELNGPSLRSAILRHVGEDLDAYEQHKARLVATLGYEDNLKRITVQLSGASPEEIYGRVADLAVGIAPSLEMKLVDIVDSRFGIERSLMNEPSSEPAVLFAPEADGSGELVLQGRSCAARVRLPCQIFAGGPFSLTLPRAHRRLRFVVDGGEIRLQPSGGAIAVHASFSMPAPGERMSLLRASRRARMCNVLVDPAGSEATVFVDGHSFGKPLAFPAMDGDYMNHYARVVLGAEALAHAVGLDLDLELEPHALLAEDDLTFFASREVLRATLACTGIEIPADRAPVFALFPRRFNVGPHRVYVVVGLAGPATPMGAVPTLRGWSPQDSSLRPRVVDGRDRSS